MGEEHPIESLMVTAMNSIKQMIDVNTIIGEPIKALDNTVIIPISKVGFGFAAGGSEFNDETVNSYNRKEKEENIKYRLPFGGGSGAGVNITPVAFLIVQNDNVKLLEATHGSVLDKLVEYVPDVIEKVNQLFNKKMDKDNNEEEFIDFEEDDDNFDEDDNDFDIYDEDYELDNLDYASEEDIITESSDSSKDEEKNQDENEEKNKDEKKITKIKKESKKSSNKGKGKKLEEKIKEVTIEEDDDEEDD